MEGTLTTSSILMRLLLAIILGAIMGLERDPNLKRKVEKPSQPQRMTKSKFSFITGNIPASGLGGLRTYILIGLLGALSGLAYYFKVEALMWIISGGLILFILTSFVLNYFDKNTFGLTTEISIIIVYTLALLLFASNIEPKLIVAISIFNSFVLSIKGQTRHIVSRFSTHEVVDTLKFVLFTIVILPFLSNFSYSIGDFPVVGEFAIKTFGKGFVEITNVFNPYRLWLVVVFVSGINFVGYFLSKMLGKNRGLNIVGLLGGLISSTTVTESMAAASRSMTKDSSKDLLISATVLANMSSFFRIFIVTLVINVELGLKVAIPMIVMGAFLLIWFAVESSLTKKDSHDEIIETRHKGGLGLSFNSPFAFKPALIFMVLFLGVTLFTKIAHYYLGESGFLVSSMISSLTGLDAIAINTANLVGTEVTMELGIIVLVTAACANLVIKGVFAIMFGDKYFSRKILGLFVVTIIIGVVAMLLMLGTI